MKEGNKNVMSQTSAEINPDLNRGYAELSIEKCLDAMVLKFFGQIILNKILEAAGNPTTPFNLIKETVSVVLESKVSVGEKGVLDFYKGFEDNSRQHLCNFFGALVKYGEKDVRY